jgi:hypothetical protein
MMSGRSTHSKGGANTWASFSRSIEVLQGNDASGDTRLLIRLGRTRREIDFDRWVLYCATGLDVGEQLINEYIPSWRALARLLQWFSDV